jgi:hypothetical protein
MGIIRMSGLIVLAIIITGCTLTSVQETTVTEPTSSAEVATLVDELPTVMPDVIDLGNGYTLSLVEDNSSSDTPKNEIRIQKPVLSGADPAVVDPFNQAVDAAVGTRLTEFLTAINQTTSLPTEIADIGSSLQITTGIYTANGSVISVRLMISEYIAGAAHPFSVLNTINYDLTARRILQLTDVFTVGTTYLDTMSAYALDTIRAIYGESIFADGAAPTEANYRNWNIKPDGLLISFEQGQVGPSAAGTVEVVVPYAVLHSVIRPDGVLGVYVG